MEHNKKASIRILRETDPEKISDILSDFQDYDFFEFLKDEEKRREYAEKLSENSFFTVAYCEGEVLGCLSMYMNDIDSGYVYTTFLAVKSDMGILSSVALVRMCHFSLLEAQKRKFKLLRFEVEKENRNSQRLVKTLGFRYVGDASEHSIYMEAPLDDVTDRIAKFDSRFKRMEGFN